MSKIKGEIEEVDEIRETSRGSYKLGVKIAGNWYGVFGSKAELEDIVKQAEVGAIADVEYEMRGKYRNVSEILIAAPQKKTEHREPSQADEKKHEEKIGREILDEHRKRRIEFFREDIEDAIAVLEPVAQKHKISHEVYWDAVIRIATTLHIGSTKRGRI